MLHRYASTLLTKEMHLDHLMNCMISQSSHFCEKIARPLLVCGMLVCGMHFDSYKPVSPFVETLLAVVNEFIIAIIVVLFSRFCAEIFIVEECICQCLLCYTDISGELIIGLVAVGYLAAASLLVNVHFISWQYVWL